MKYYINYNTDGKILGFVKQDTNLNIEVSNTQWIEAQKFNKIVVNGTNVTFDKVDWRTLAEIEAQRVSNIKTEAGRIILERYPIIWQINRPRLDTQYESDYAWIDNIRDQSNQLELDSTKTKDDFAI